ncbi:uncharacterized protein LOC125756484 [Rhipicephalus sanguineus]|uniref:uncharacterized protein LOC125756484 n=1 Tax=Rhipicephalus sanguineus TaxID=34632 RepID=UPI0020C42E97|nr:uncharacterized protein LOC125756484 [Rhipicephalus sanguineus]
MPMCAMTGCSARSTSAAQKMDLEPRTGLYRLPKVITRQCDRTKVLSEQRRRLWLARINRKGLKNLDYLRVCGRRFISGHPASLMDNTNPDWVPSQHLGYSNRTAPGVNSTSRYKRAKNRLAKKKKRKERWPQPRTQLTFSRQRLTILRLKWSMQTITSVKRRLLNNFTSLNTMTRLEGSRFAVTPLTRPLVK